MNILRHSVLTTFLLAGCATSGVNQSNDFSSRGSSFEALLGVKPISVGAAINVGRELSLSYTIEGRRLKQRRLILDLGLLAASTFVTTTAALEANPDTILAGAIAGQTISRLDPIINTGGVETWSGAATKMTCTLGALSASQSSNVLNSYKRLKSSSGEPPSAVARYDNLTRLAMSKYTAIYGSYIQNTTASLISDEQFNTIVAASQQGTEAENAALTVPNVAPNTAPIATSSDEADQSLIPKVNDTLQQDINTVNATVDAIEANVMACN